MKSPATAMGAASFRHGPQEIVQKDMRFGIWIDGARMREQDLALARDLRKLGARVMLIGQRLPSDAGDLVFQLPEIASEWQFLIDIIPAQLVAERLARLSAPTRIRFGFARLWWRMRRGCCLGRSRKDNVPFAFLQKRYRRLRRAGTR